MEHPKDQETTWWLSQW